MKTQKIVNNGGVCGCRGLKAGLSDLVGDVGGREGEGKEGAECIKCDGIGE